MRVRRLEGPEDRAALAALLAGAEPFAGLAPLSEEHLRDLDAGGPAGIGAFEDGALVAVAHLLAGPTGGVVETVLAPEAGRRAAAAVVAAALDAAGSPVRVWAKDPDTAAAAAEAGLREARTLQRLECPLPPARRPDPPDGVRLAPYRRGCDEEAYLLVSNEAFAGHPDSGGWDREVLARRMARPWFDPAGVCLAWERGRPVGLCWTKLHPGEVGEIYSVAVRPGAGGRGLGRALTWWGLDHLWRERGARRGLLYADRANAGAVAIYGALGFTPVAEMTEYAPG